MAAKATLRSDPQHQKELRRAWRRSFKRFERAHRKCEGSLREKHVHQLRVAARHCLSVLEVLRAVHAGEEFWSMAHGGMRDLLKVLGRLRDAQVRRSQVRKMKGQRRVLQSLLRKAKAAEKMARPAARAALALFPGPSPKSIRSVPVEGGAEHWRKAIAGVLAYRSKRLAERWAAIDRRRPTSIHRARVALKRYRYLLIALGPILGAAERRRMPELERLQGIIGEWHDGHLFREWLRTSGLKDAKLLNGHAGRDQRIDDRMNALLAARSTPTGATTGLSAPSIYLAAKPS